MMYFVQYKSRAWEWITMNMAANRTRKGSLPSHYIRTMGHCRKRAVGSRSRTSPLPSRIDASRTTEGMGPRLWTTPLVALTGTLVLSPPRIRRVPGFSTHPIQAGRPSKPSAFRGSDVASCRAQRVAIAVRTAEGVGPRMWTTPFGSRPRSTAQRKVPAGPSSNYR